MDILSTDKNKIVLTLSRDEAIVLIELLSRFTQTDKLNIDDHSEERVLWDICADLEKLLDEPFDPNWNEILKRSRERVLNKNYE